MRYEGMIYRPPSEAYSLIVQVTIGCSQNRCIFCSMFKEKRFRIRKVVEVLEDLQDARNKYRYVEKIFLADGDALICKMTDLEAILHFIKDQFPECKQVTLYGSPRSILMKQQEDLDKLRALGISMIYMGLESGNDDEMDIMEVTLPKRRHSSIELTQEELDAIYVRTPDPKKNRSTGPVTVRAKEKTREPGSAYQDPKWEARRRAKAGTEEYLLVDGYNIIFSWEELKELSERDIGAARGKLADILSNYQGFRKCTLILVYDAYKVEGNPGEVMKYHNIYIVYTKEAETADQYIEKTVRRIAKNADVTVATSDGLEQVIIMGQGAHRMSAPGLKEEVELALKELRGDHLGRQVNLKNYLLDYLDEETAKQMEEIRLGKEKC